MMNFYGFEARLGERITVTRAPNFAAKAAGWLSPGDHNHLRITRILRCLTVLGLETETMTVTQIRWVSWFVTHATSFRVRYCSSHHATLPKGPPSKCAEVGRETAVKKGAD
jgi:hypothetical protein